MTFVSLLLLVALQGGKTCTQLQSTAKRTLALIENQYNRISYREYEA